MFQLKNSLKRSRNMKKYVLISVSVLLSMIYMYFLCDVKKGKGITYLTDNQIKNIMAYTIDNETVSEMPTKGSGYIAKSITCKNGSVLVWDNDNWKVEVKKLETYDTCNVDFTLDDLVYNFDYNGTNGSDGSVQEFTAPVSGKYVLEVWGAQGGIASSTYIGGYGGYSTGIVSLTKGEKLYIVVGGKGTNNSTLETIPGGYNGGGNGSGSANLVYSSSGGGATHIGKASGLLNTLSNNISDIIIVAGGGGGTSFQTGPYSGNGGSGGGYIGNNGTNTQSDYVYGSGGSQTAGGSSGGGSKVNNEDRGLNGSFGQGGNGQHYSGGGGGGFYGGGASNQAGAGGGSGYIGNSLLSNKVMYCYKCTASSSENIKTISTDNVSSTPISNYAKKENGKFGILRILQNDRIRSLPLLCIYRINEQQQRQAVTGVFDTADIDTIQKLCQKEKMHLKYESIGKNESKEITKMTYEQLCSSLKKGIYQVAFSIYRQGKDWQSLSMADQGFEKPAYLHLKGDKNYLELAVREMKAMTKGGAMLSGHIQTVKCRSSKDVLTDLPIQDKKIQIPFEDFEFEQLSETEITGQIQLFMTSSVGEKRMPESMATLILKI